MHISRVGLKSERPKDELIINKFYGYNNPYFLYAY